ncbi:MAG: hypothetical protein PUG10_01200 [Lachnospiraceae bacterium]|nr:hypothetical protein [Lachnospiraceae bacterium]
MVVSQNVVSVSIEEIDREKWDEVYRKDIYGNRKYTLSIEEAAAYFRIGEALFYW